MANKQLGALTAAGTLDGTETVHVVQGGNSRRATASAVAALAGGWNPDTPVIDIGGVVMSTGEILVSGTAIVLDMAGEPLKDLILDHNATITVTGETAGQLGVYIWIEQGVTGGTVAWSGVDKWLSGAAPTLGANTGDVDLILLSVRPNGTVVGDRTGPYS